MIIELLEIELFDIWLCVNKWEMFNRIVRDTKQYLQPINCV